jgi:hypothetical protein
MGELILKRASASRPSGEWNKDDFDALADGAVVGRIFRANASPVIQVAKATYLSVSGLNVIAPHHGVSYRETNTLLVACAKQIDRYYVRRVNANKKIAVSLRWTEFSLALAATIITAMVGVAGKELLGIKFDFVAPDCNRQ